MKKRHLRTLLVLLILALLPAISWYYLKSGMDYRLEMNEELSPIAEMPSFDFRQQMNSASLHDLNGNVSFVANCGEEPELIDVFKSVADQFDGRKDYYAFIGDTTEHQGFDQINRLYGFNPTGQWIRNFESASGAKWRPGTAILVDTMLRMRHVYDLRDEDQVTRLVEHTAIVLPLKTKKRMRE